MIRALGIVSLFVLALAANSPAGDLPPLKLYMLGAPEQKPEAVEAAANGAVTINTAGRDRWSNMDAGSFAGFETDALNFTFVARIAAAGEGGRGTRFGIAARAGLAGNDKTVALRYDASEDKRCLNWFMRYHVAATSHQGSRRAVVDGDAREFDKPAGTWLKLVRRYPYVRMYASADGKDWKEMPYLAALLPQKVWLGVQATAGRDGKEPFSATFDNISFTADKGDAMGEALGAFREYTPSGKYTIYFAKVSTGTPDKPAFATSYVIIPDGMDPKAIRCLLWTPGSKEVLLADGGSLPFRSGDPKTPDAALRLPADFDKEEGAYHTDKLDPVHLALAHHGIVRLASIHRHYPASLKRLAEVSGIKELANLPFVSTGASAAGGSAATAAQMYPDFCVASCPTLIGPAGLPDVAKHAKTPFLHIVGSKDGGHLGDVTKAAPIERQAHALWGSAPMWWVYHHTHKQQSLMWPYFIDCIRLRVPEGHDFAKGPAKLNELKEEDGYLGLIDTWETNRPRTVPFRKFEGDQANAVWLPTPWVARTWEAFVSYDPRTVIHFPMFEGHNTMGQAQPNGWHNTSLAAGEPFEIAASGPTGPNVKVEFYADLKPLPTKARDAGNPYRVTAEGLPAGLHVLYAITTADGKEEISRPVTVMFYPKTAR